MAGAHTPLGGALGEDILIDNDEEGGLVGQLR
jgi:hypothetical protein